MGSGGADCSLGTPGVLGQRAGGGPGGEETAAGATIGSAPLGSAVVGLVRAQPASDSRRELGQGLLFLWASLSFFISEMRFPGL